MKRNIVEIDEEKCNGCGLCVPNCAEGAIQIIDGKARLVKDMYCDGLGACLGHCPVDAIKIIERDADAYDQDAVNTHLAATGKAPHTRQEASEGPGPHHGGCPGSALRSFSKPSAPAAPGVTGQPTETSQLGQWPIQMMLVPAGAPFLQDADLVVCADCVPFAVPDFHRRYLTNRAVLVGCPKLDDLDFYIEKLTDIFQKAKPRSVTVLRMEVPCCGGMAHAVMQARTVSGNAVPCEIHIVGIQGGITVQTIP